MRILSRLALVAALGVAGSEAVAQGSAASPVSIVPRAGWLRYAEATSIRPAPYVGFDVLYRVTPWLRLGSALAVSQPNTDGDDFPTAFQYGDTTFLFRASQPLTLFDAGLQAHATLPVLGRLAPYAVGGVGYYTLYMDPQTTGEDRRLARMSLQVGAGADVRITDRAGIRLEVRDLVMTGYDRDRLNPVNQQSFDAYRRFSAVLPARTESEKGAAMNNLMFSIGFTFTPSRDEGDDQ